jgi:hypothetical protein
MKHLNETQLKAVATKVIYSHKISIASKMQLERLGYTVIIVQDENKGLPKAPWYSIAAGKVTKY